METQIAALNALIKTEQARLKAATDEATKAAIRAHLNNLYNARTTLWNGQMRKMI